eukprot:59710-Chlamydomonas_euryale.AAC.2
MRAHEAARVIMACLAGTTAVMHAGPVAGTRNAQQENEMKGGKGKCTGALYDESLGTCLDTPALTHLP